MKARDIKASSGLLAWSQSQSHVTCFSSLQCHTSSLSVLISQHLALSPAPALSSSLASLLSGMTQQTNNVDILRLELLQRGFSITHPLIQGKIKIHPELQGELYFHNDSPTSLLLVDEDFQRFLPEMKRMKDYHDWQTGGSRLQKFTGSGFPLFHSHIQSWGLIKCQVLNLSQLKSHEDPEENNNSISSSLSDCHLDPSLDAMMTRADDIIDLEDTSWRLESCLASFDYHHHNQEREPSLQTDDATCICDIGDALSITKCRKKAMTSEVDIKHRKKRDISRRVLLLTQNIRAMFNF